ncbi:MAG: four helix bundle protein [Verrucomicrobiota bacterium]
MRKLPDNIRQGCRFWVGGFGFWIHVIAITEAEFKRKTQTLASNIITFSEKIPRNRAHDIIAHQLIRCSTSVGANYRAACRAKSTADMIAKLAMVEEETDETMYGLELPITQNIVNKADAQKLLEETESILKMIVSSIRTLKRKK